MKMSLRQRKDGKGKDKLKGMLVSRHFYHE
jgi:hypothetical protein